MLKIFYPSLMILVFSILTGCATESTIKNDVALSRDVPITVGEIENRSDINPEDGNAIILMSEAMTKALSASQLKIGHGGYDMHLVIKEYDPGSAFKRWLMPGWGETKLTVECVIKGSAGERIGTVEITRAITAGGGYTVGAWRDIFDEVAKSVVYEMQRKIT